MRAFLQLGKNAGKPSISVAVDVATDLMTRNGITPKFTLDESGITSHCTVVEHGVKAPDSTALTRISSGMDLL